MQDLGKEAEQCHSSKLFLGEDIGCWGYDLSSGTGWWSKEAQRLHGVASGTPLSLQFIKMLLGAEEWQKFVDIDEQLEQIDRFCIQYRVKQEGQERWLEATGERIDGEMLAGSVRDVTAAWNEQEQLRNRRLEFDLLNRYLERTANTVDLQEIVIDAQSTVRRIMDVLIFGIFVYSDGRFYRVIPDRVDEQDEAAAFSDEHPLAYRTVQTGKIVEVPIEEYPDLQVREYLLHTKARKIICFPIRGDGRTIAALSVAHSQNVGITPEQCEFLRTLCRYLSAQIKNAMLFEQVKKELKERTRAENDLNTIFDESIDFIATIGPENKFCRINAAFIKKLGYPKRILLSRPFFEFIDPLDREYAHYVLRQVRTCGAMRGFCHRYVCIDGQVIHLEINATLMRGEDSLVMIARDITNQKQIEARNLELERSFAMEKLKSEFFANLSHEFKTPINIILSSLQLLTMKLKRSGTGDWSEDYKKLCSYIEQNSYKLLRLTANLVDSTRIDNSHLALRLERCEIIPAVQESVASALPYAETKGITISFAASLQEGTSIDCDRDMVDRILLNLLSNAIKNTPEGGKIQVLVSASEKEIEVAVKDNGGGIPIELLPYIFERFCTTRLGGLVRRSDGGGLGLSICKALVEMHHGVISAENNPDGGATFRFTLSRSLHGGEPVGGVATLKQNLSRDNHLKRAQIELSDL
ncbi:PAS domain S-box protein [Clostridiaceae bacterium NSJ-31]|uniref:histidine kinase n=8 Tax=Ligaoa zhengdingensis TaxID=2763658 RepID=A0A926DUW9_9FIRM|nr:ATP-binding protein [Ligaoa zhengdingensis]MBC8545783.1 PAS domain S-box protein [Ligaoa zhengdingensis]